MIFVFYCIRYVYSWKSYLQCDGIAKFSRSVDCRSSCCVAEIQVSSSFHESQHHWAWIWQACRQSHRRLFETNSNLAHSSVVMALDWYYLKSISAHLAINSSGTVTFRKRNTISNKMRWYNAYIVNKSSRTYTAMFVYMLIVLILNKWSKKFDKKLHRRGGFFSRGTVNAIQANREQCSRLQQSRWCRYWLFAAYTAAVLLPLGGSGPHLGKLDPHLIVVSFAQQNLLINRHLGRFSRFCRVHERDQQTDTQTRRQTALLCL